MPDLPRYRMLVENPVRIAELAGLLLKPPAWTRLEPQTLSGEPAAGVEMRVADALWMLARQWQMGGFRGEDCGTPVSVRLTATTQPLTGLRPGDAGDAAGRAGAPAALPRPLPADCALEPLIEAEGWTLPTLRDRAEAAHALIAALAPLGWEGAAQLLAACPFDPVDTGAGLPAPDDNSGTTVPAPDAAWRLIAARTPDAEKVALAMEAGPPGWLAAEATGATAAVQQAAQDWLGWYRRNVSPRAHADSSWIDDRLEYRFGLQAGAGTAARRLEAPCHPGGAIDWFSFDLKEGQGLGLTAPEPGPGDIVTHTAHVHASRLRFPGMPARRLWQFEDGLVNFGLTDVQSNDLLRLLFLEYATIYGSDWLVAPIDLPRGSLAAVGAVSYRTTFGEEITVLPAADMRGGGAFSLFTTEGPQGAETCFLIPPNARQALEGPAREEVVFARDETANVVWAIERSHEGVDGLARDLGIETGILPQPGRPQPGADDAWTLEILPPGNWIPMVPMPQGESGGFILRKGSFDGRDCARGRMLAPKPFDLRDEEVPREGVRVRRLPALLRDENGALHRWTARRVGPAWGEARSRLEYDATRGPA